jgi:DNA polymerase III subunit gamma/tau
MQLALRYRPKSFEEMIGQQDAVNIVKGLIKNKTILSRGLLLYGPYGIGKTSLGRIIAHHLNCDNYDYEQLRVCGACDFCKMVAEVGKDPAVEEMDFGNTRGIDTVRALIDSLEYVPQFKARVIILDECHMMTSSAATALLKALEEPPENIVFLLLTTDPNKINQALRSRCVKVPFGRIPQSLLLNHLVEVAYKEGVTLPVYAFTYITKSCDGIMREALMYLDALMAIVRIDPTADLNDHHFLEEKLEIDSISPATLANFLIGSVYVGSYGKTLAILQKIMSSPTFKPIIFAARLYEYHIQTFHFLIDNNKTQTILFNDYYLDWYTTLATKNIKLTVTSAIILIDLILDLQNKLKNFESNPEILLTSYSIKMVQAIK